MCGQPVHAQHHVCKRIIGPQLIQERQELWTSYGVPVDSLQLYAFFSGDAGDDSLHLILTLFGVYLNVLLLRRPSMRGHGPLGDIGFIKEHNPEVSLQSITNVLNILGGLLYNSFQLWLRWNLCITDALLLDLLHLEQLPQFVQCNQRIWIPLFEQHQSFSQ